MVRVVGDKCVETTEGFTKATSNIRRELKHLKKKDEESQQKIVKLESECTKVNDDLAALKGEFNSLRKQNDSLSKANRFLRDKTSEMDRLKEKVSELEKVQEENARLKLEVTRLRDGKASVCREIHDDLVAFLGSLGARAGDLNTTDGVLEMGEFVDWMRSEVKDLPGIVEKANDFAAFKSFESLMSLLCKEGCDHYRAIGRKDYVVDPKFSDSVEKVCTIVGKGLVQKLWQPYGRELARRAAAERLDKVKNFVLFFISSSCLHFDVLRLFCL